MLTHIKPTSRYPGTMSSATVLVVDDDEATVRLLSMMLERSGARALPATSGPQALRQAFQYHPDAVLLDINMPGLDGLLVCQRLRDLSDVPIIIVSALSSTEKVTAAFAVGADDFVGKPFEISELLARVQACLRRAPQTAGTQDSLALANGDLVIDLRRHNVWVRQQDIHLTRTEFDLLVYLARNRGRVLTHAMLKSTIWGEESAVGHDSLKQFIGTLRRKIELDPRHPQWLVSEHGVGYSLLLE